MFKSLSEAITGSGIKNNPGINSLSDILIVAANTAIIIAAGFSTAALAYSFIQLAMASGDPKAVQKAYSSITWSVIGLVLSILAYVLRRVLYNLLGLPNVKDNF